jgi:thiamine-phosphate diphosphorylase
LNDLRERLVLYAVTDRAWLAAARATLDGQVEEAVRGGATMVQLREKGMDDAAYAALARRVKAVTDVFGVPLIVNDSLEAAITSDAAGLHVGQADGDVREIRVRLGPGKILGVSTQTGRRRVRPRLTARTIWAWGRSFRPRPSRCSRDPVKRIGGDLCGRFASRSWPSAAFMPAMRCC